MNYFHTRKEAKNIIRWTILLLNDKIKKSKNTVLKICVTNLGSHSKAEDFETALNRLELSEFNRYFQMIGELAVKFDLTSQNLIKNGRVIESCAHEEGAVKAAMYILKEIQQNSKSNIVKYIHSGNYTFMEQKRKPNLLIDNNIILTEKLTAIALWFNQVRTDGDWDHKPKIEGNSELNRCAVTRMMKSGTISSRLFHKYKEHDYFYDVWSNIHYGYVGMVCGFTEDELLDGAGAAQYIDDLKDLSDDEIIPLVKDASVKGWRKYDSIGDRVSIEIGITLYKKTGGDADALTMQDILNKLEAQPNLGESRLIHTCNDPNNFTPV